MRRPRLLALVLPTIAAAACFKMQLHTTVHAGVPAALRGHWTGSWSSTAGGSNGAIALRVPEFLDHPVLRLDTDHPCIHPGRYTFVSLGLHFELRSGDQPVFVATLDPETRTLAGTYQCPEDRGDWAAHWDGELPAIGDLTGSWQGAISGGQPAQTLRLELELQQRWEDGFLLLDGTVRLPDVQFEQPLGGGLVEWHTDHFELLLRVDGAVGAVLMLQAIGDVDHLSVQDGIVAVDDPRVPFHSGLWSAARAGP